MGLIALSVEHSGPPGNNTELCTGWVNSHSKGEGMKVGRVLFL